MKTAAAKKRSEGSAKEKLLKVGTELFRRTGYVGTSVDQICEAAGVTKGAFFHHFESKEALCQACLEEWDRATASLMAGRANAQTLNPSERLIERMDFIIRLFSNAKLLKSCLAGTTAQEVSESNPKLRDAANACFLHGGQRFAELIENASRHQKKKLESASLARLWIAALQGAILLAKASQDGAVIPQSLRHVRNYILNLLELEPAPSAQKRARKPR